MTTQEIQNQISQVTHQRLGLLEQYAQINSDRKEAKNMVKKLYKRAETILDDVKSLTNQLRQLQEAFASTQNSTQAQNLTSSLPPSVLPPFAANPVEAN